MRAHACSHAALAPPSSPRPALAPWRSPPAAAPPRQRLRRARRRLGERRKARPERADQEGPEDRVPAQAGQQPVLDTSTTAAARRRPRSSAAGYKEVGPSDASASSQVSLHQHADPAGQDVILIAANDPNAVCGPLKQARRPGIKVVAYDSDTAQDCRDLFINQATSEEHRPQPDQADRRADSAARARSRSCRRRQRDEPEHLDRVDEERAGEARVHEASSSSRSPTATTTTRSRSRRPRACCRPTRT